MCVGGAWWIMRSVFFRAPILVTFPLLPLSLFGTDADDRHVRFTPHLFGSTLLSSFRRSIDCHHSTLWTRKPLALAAGRRAQDLSVAINTLLRMSEAIIGWVTHESGADHTDTLKGQWQECAACSKPRNELIEMAVAIVNIRHGARSR